jgi:AcrR family transcriptional regulator
VVRTPGSSRDTTWPLIRQVGVDLLYEFGYENMNTRQLAREVGLKPGSLYYYFDTKEDFLYRVVSELLIAIIEDIDTRLDGVTDAAKRLDVFIETLVSWHVDKHKETSIARMEMRSLSPDKAKSYLALRNRFDEIFDDILVAGAAEGLFVDDQNHLYRISILTMITNITGWYRPTGPLKHAALVKFYRDLVVSMLNPAKEAPPVSQAPRQSARRKR